MRISLGIGTGVTRLPPSSEVADEPMPESVGTIVTFGDSITAGTAASTTNNRWANRVATALGATLLNKGVSGTVLQNSNDSGGSPRANNGRDRYVTDTTGANKKDMVICAYGLNDLRYTAAPSTMNITNFEHDYREIVQGWLDAGYEQDDIVLVTPYWIPDAGYASGSTGFTGSDRETHEAHVAVVKEIAADFGVYLADAYQAMKDEAAANGDSFMDDDDIHPLDAGHAIIADAVLAARRVPVFIPDATPDAFSFTDLTGQELGTVVESDEITVTGINVPVPITITGGEYQVNGGEWTDEEGTVVNNDKVKVRHTTSASYSTATNTVPTIGGVSDTFTSTTKAEEGEPGGDTMLFADNFGDPAVTEGVAITGRSATGGTWAEMAGSTNDVVGSTGGSVRKSGSTNGICRVYLGAAEAGTKQYAQGVLAVKTNSGNLGAQLWLFGNSSASHSGFALDYAGSSIRIFRYTSGALTVLSPTYDVVLPAGDHNIRFECEPGVQRAYLEGELVLETEDAQADAGGYMGLASRTGGGASMSATTGPQWRSVEFGTFD